MNNQPRSLGLFLLIFVFAQGANASLLPTVGTESSDAEAPKVAFDILQSREIKIEDRTVTLNRVNPPDLPKKARAQRVRIAEPTEAELAAMKEASAKEQMSLLIEATEYESGVANLRWRYDGEAFEVWSTADFTIFPGFGQIETDDIRVTFMILPSKAPRENDSSKWIPEADDFDSANADYFFVAGIDDDGTSPSAHAIEAMHLHYETNEEALRSAHAARREAQLERERELAENPPQPEDAEIHFWSIQSRLHQ